MFPFPPESLYYPGSKEGHIPTRCASEESGAFPSLARRVNMQQHKVIYQPDAPARDPVRFPRWRVGLERFTHGLARRDCDVIDTNPKRERGFRSIPSLTLRVSMACEPPV